tara:strand:- start:205 stop:972 length:768 start_codon:yes stop_codon:yes gene_type:complete
MENQAQTEPTFEIPFDVIELPSKGVLYQGNISHVKVEYLTAADENILTSPNLLQSGKVIDYLLEQKIKQAGVSSSDLLVGDRNAIMIFLRATGYGEMYPVKLTDPENGQEFEYEINLSELKTKELGATPDEKGEFSFSLPRSKKEIKFRLLTAKDESEILARVEKRSKIVKGSVSNTLTYRLERQITEIDGNRDKAYIAKFVTVMPAFDSLKFREYVDEIEPGVDLNVEVESPTGNFFRTPLPITLQFFWPNLGA